MTGPVPPPVVTDLDRESGLERLRQMLLIRRFEEKCVELYSGGIIRGFVHLYIGEEAIAVGTMRALRLDEPVVATYREHGHALARGVPTEAVMAEMFGKVEGCSHGRGGSMHLFDSTTKFYGGNAIVGGGLPLALGFALADRMRGIARVTACFFGDGAVAEGEFHECMNLAALWRLPLLFLCENNEYAMGTSLARSESQTDLSLKAATYEMPAWSVDGMDVLAVERATALAADAIRGGAGPHFLDLRTYRFRAHSLYDPDRYRDKAEITRWLERDPITSFLDRLRAKSLVDDDTVAALESDVAEEVAAAVAFAEAGHDEPVEDLTRWVYSESSSAAKQVVQP